MSDSSSSIIPRLLVGLTLGAAAIVVYTRRMNRSETMISRHHPVAQLEADETIHMQSTGRSQQVMTTSTTSATNRSDESQNILSRVQAYVSSARAQLDSAIAEGQMTAALTKKELEDRFTAAKKDPQAARSAFR